MDPDDDAPKKPDSKQLGASDVSSIFDLKNELLKRKSEVAQRGSGAVGTGDYAKIGKAGGILTVKADEKTRLRAETDERKRRIAEHEAAMRAEDEATRAKQQKIMREKSELYEKLQNGEVAFTHNDNTPVEFMVEFHLKKKELDEKQDREFGPCYDEWEGEDDRPRTSRAAPRKPVQPQRYNPGEDQRVYGVSHINLSQDEAKRQAKIKELYELSEATNKAREKKAQLLKKEREKRDERKAALRKRLGLPPEEKEPSPPPAPEPTYLDIPLPINETVEETYAKKLKSDRAWDRGKGTYNAWIERQREEREDEFAPPSSYHRR
ncbi:unnamed protein product, partial [Mesorhabditis spiculigera]